MITAELIKRNSPIQTDSANCFACATQVPEVSVRAAYEIANARAGSDARDGKGCCLFRDKPDSLIRRWVKGWNGHRGSRQPGRVPDVFIRPDSQGVNRVRYPDPGVVPERYTID